MYCRFLHTRILKNSDIWGQLCRQDFQVIDGPCNITIYRSLWDTQQQAVSATKATAIKLQACLESVDVLNEELIKKNEQLQVTQAQLLTETAPQLRDSPVSRTRELLFHSIVQAKIAQSTTGVIQAQGERGRPINLVKLTAAETSSEKASSKSRKRRSQTIESVMSLVSGTSNGIDGVVAQQASVIQRNKPVFLQAANCAGLKVFGRFRPDAMAALSTEIPLSAIAVLKRMFRNNFGCDPFMPLTAVRQQRQELSFEY